MSIPFPTPEKPKFTFIDLFAGIGGFRIALQALGGKCVFSSEIDTAAQRTYKTNFGEVPFGDIREFTNLEISDKKLNQLIPNHDLLTAGFPCQPFSRAGVSARNYLGQHHGFNDLEQGNLFFDITRIVKVKRPKILLLENVKNFKSHEQGKTLKIVKEIIEDYLGYSFYDKIIDSSSLVPQRRERYYMVCFRENIKYEFPVIQGQAIPLRSILEYNVADKFTISDKLWAGHQKRSKRNKERGVGFVVQLADLNKPSNTLVSRYYKDGKECLIIQQGKNPRMLTPRECARLQGFPEEFILPESSAAAYRQFGNSVAVPVVLKIAETILEKIDIMAYQPEELQKLGFKTAVNLTVWEKCYWYLRYLVRSGAKQLGKDTKRIETLYNTLTTTYKLIALRQESEEDKIQILRSVFEQTLFDQLVEDTRNRVEYERLLMDLEKLLITPKDYLVFAIAIKELMIPTNEAVEKVPTKETNEFVKKYAQAILDTKKEQGLVSLIRDWDDFTGMLAINKERDLIVELYRDVKENLGAKLDIFNESISESNLDFVLTALCQEYERRVAQKRKTRAGRDLESSIEFIFRYFGIKTGGKPMHFTAGLEIDNWVETKSGWYIGITLKRTLRERWKQTYTTEDEFYDQHKISKILWIISEDSDLSEKKITELVSYRHIFFIPDNSHVLKNLKKHPEIGKYLFPMTELIDQVQNLIENC